MARKMIPVEDRFWPHVEKIDNGCWLWRGYVGKRGYGYLGIGSECDGTKRRILVHRFAFRLLVGDIPEGMSVLHSCDVPTCVRPDHLFAGTDQDNRSDMAKKGRGRKGSSAFPTGVRKRSTVRPWSRPYIASVCYLNKAIHLGSFYTEEAAASAVAAKRRELYG